MVIGDDDTVTATLTIEFDGTGTLTANHTFDSTTTTSQTFDTSGWAAFTEFDFSIAGIIGSIAGNRQPAEILSNALATFENLNASGAGIILVPEP